MNKILVRTLFLLMLMSGTIAPVLGQLQLSPEQVNSDRTLLKIAPFKLISETIFFSVERLNQDFDRGLSIGLGYANKSDFSDNERSIMAEVQYRFYFNGFKDYDIQNNKASIRRGVYAGIYLDAEYTRVETEFSVFNPIGNFSMFDSNIARITSFNPGAIIGVQRTVGKLIYMDFFIGVGVRVSNITNSNEEFTEPDSEDISVFDPTYKGAFPKIGFNIGIGF